MAHAITASRGSELLSSRLKFLDRDMLEPEPPTTDERFIGLASFLVLIFLGVVFVLETRQPTAGFVKRAADLSSLTLALLGAIAGVWWFLKRDPAHPRLSIEQTGEVVAVTAQGTLTHVSAVLKNVGDTSITLREWRLWICPFDPLPSSVARKLIEKDGVCAEGDLVWESCVGTKLRPERFGEVRLRPGESQQVVATVVIPPGPRVVRIYSSFPHPRLNRKPGENRGWSSYSVLKLTKSKEETDDSLQQKEHDGLKARHNA